MRGLSRYIATVGQVTGAEGGLERLIPFSHFTEQISKCRQFVRSLHFTSGPLS
jgi:hypothetical protein